MGATSGVRKRSNLRHRSTVSRPGAFVIGVFAVAILLISPNAFAQNLNRYVWLDIKPQRLASALLEFGKQAHIQIMFASQTAVGRIRTQELRGRYARKRALAILLRRTGLTYVEHGDSVEVVPVRSRATVAPATKNKAQRHQDTTDTQNTDDPKTSPGPKEKHKRNALQEIVVTGSRLKAPLADVPQEVKIYDRQQIDQSGQNSIADFLSTLPSVSVRSPIGTNGFLSTVQLRGLPVGSTLVLLDGRRIEGSSARDGLFFDLNNIPLAAVKKIEVEENGASAVYGSDAIAGVVNIILKKNFNGLALNAKYAWAKDTHVIRANLAWGRQWKRGGISLIGSYDIDGGLLNSDRLLSASNDYRRYGGPDGNYPVCFPGNVFSLTGSPLPGAPPGSGSTYAAITGSTHVGRPPLSQFTYGSLNQCSIVAGFAILPQIRRTSLYLQGHFELTPDVHLFASILYSHLNEVASLGHLGLFGIPSYQAYTVSASNPYNPFGTTVGIAESLSAVPLSEPIYTDFLRPVIGLKGTLAGRWKWQVSAWQSTDWSHVLSVNQIYDPAAVQSALNSSIPADALNPFVNGPVGSPTLLRSLFMTGSEKLMSRDRSAQAYVSGPVTRLPGGTAHALIGVDYDRNTLYENLINDGVHPPNTHVSFQRRHYAVFAEARIPLIGRLGGSRSESLLSMTVSGRHDQYSGVGGATTKQLGLVAMPLADLIIRGTWGDAFQAPTLENLYGSRSVTQEFLHDPATGMYGFVPVLAGGNPGLHPISGHSHTVGLFYFTPALRGWSISVTQWKVVENNVIQNVQAQVIVDNSNLFPGRVIRNSSGSIITVNDTNLNFGSIDVAGMDYELSYRHHIRSGQLSIRADATETYHYIQAITIASAPTEAVSKAQDNGNWAPKWKGLLDVGWKEGSLRIHLDGRYTGAYQDYGGERRIGNVWIFDGNVRLTMGRRSLFGSRWLRRSYVEIGGRNLLNTGPQFSNYEFGLYGYDPAQSSILGRELYVEVGARL